MQGGQGHRGKGKDPLDRSATGGYNLSERMEQFRETGGTGAYRLSDLTASGRQPALPKRPPGMMHLDQPPPTPRVARPRREIQGRKPKTWKWWAGAGCLTVVGLIVIGMLVYAVTNLFLAVSVSAGSATTATDFLASLQSANYDQAYNDLGASLTVQLSRGDFKQMALADDHCYGQVTDYSEVSGSAVTSQDGNTQSFTYTITRSKLAKSYQLRLTLQKNAAGDWDIINFGGDLGPAPPTCQ
jgi:hypothetical protein